MSQSNSTSISTAIKIVALLWERGDPYPYTNDAETEMQVTTTSKQLLAFALRGGAYFHLNSQRRFNSPVDASYIADVSILVPTSKSSAVGAASWTVQDFGKFKPYWELLADAANAGDGKKVSAYLFSLGIGNPAVSVAIGLGMNSSLVVKDATGHDIALKANDSAEILLLPTRRGSADLSVQWTKDHKGFNIGIISNFSGGDFDFSLHTGAAGSP
jgi:hypothetical protein